MRYECTLTPFIIKTLKTFLRYDLSVFLRYNLGKKLENIPRSTLATFYDETRR